MGREERAQKARMEGWVGEKFLAQVNIKVIKLKESMVSVGPTGAFEPQKQNPASLMYEAGGDGSTPRGAIAKALGELQIALDQGIAVSIEDMYRTAFEEEQKASAIEAGPEPEKATELKLV